MRHWRGLVAASAALVTPVIVATSANAGVMARNVYAPVREGGIVRAWADINYDCSGTYGCWAYMKIERKTGWWWKYVDGRWVNSNGWNSAVAGLASGCHDYRATVVTYNDVLVSDSTQTQTASTTTSSIKRVETPWSSGTTRICR